VSSPKLTLDSPGKGSRQGVSSPKLTLVGLHPVGKWSPGISYSLLKNQTLTGLPPTTNGGRRAYNIALGGACTNANPMTMLYGPRTFTFKQDYPGVGLVGISSDGMGGLTKPPLVA
jgi:hypothetical protein